jgi:hypothetical protein
MLGTLVLGPFAETKVARLPGRNPALQNAKIKPQYIQENGNAAMNFTLAQISEN